MATPFSKLLALFRPRDKGINLSTSLPYNDFSSLVKSDNYLDQYFGWTYIAVKKKADTVASVRLRLMNGEKEMDMSKGSDKQARAMLRDLAFFNAHMSLADALRYLIIHLSLTGLAAWFVIEPQSKLAHKKEFFSLRPDRLTIVPDPITGLPLAYRYRNPDGAQNV